MRRGPGKKIDWNSIKSPCVKVCKLEGGVCKGCGRTQDEIREWLILTEKQRDLIMQRLEKPVPRF